MLRPPPRPPLFPYPPLFRSVVAGVSPAAPADQRGAVGAVRAVDPAAAAGGARAHRPAPGIGSGRVGGHRLRAVDRKSTRLNSSHANISYAVFCLKKKKTNKM